MASKSREARSLAVQADTLREQGCYDEAEALFRQAIALAEQAFGPNHLEVAAILNNMAVLLKYTGRFDEAESLYGRALAITQQSHGANHPEVAAIYHNLGGLEHDRGRYAAGEWFARQSVEIRKRRPVPIRSKWPRTSPQ